MMNINPSDVYLGDIAAMQPGHRHASRPFKDRIDKALVCTHHHGRKNYGTFCSTFLWPLLKHLIKSNC